MFSHLLGGIGLFLLGMILLTDGLKALAGGALRGVLTRSTSNRYQAVASGAAITAMVQSSSATTLATIGFVSAGLLPFAQAVGVIVGAAVGTTSTGWIVSLLGIKLSIGAIAMPLVGLGALARLLGKGRIANAGLALAGFGVIFVGIATLQTGMEGVASQFDLSRLHADTIGQRLILVAIGFGMTVVMQSSSAAVATTMTALHTGVLGFEQACVLVIGQNIGTASTSAIASIGASTPAKRTALAHVLFNVCAGAIGFALLPLALWTERTLDPDGSERAMALAAFHTAFNVLAVAVFTPWLGKYAAFVTRIIPERGPALTRFLDLSVANVPGVAVEAARRTLLETARVVVEAAIDALSNDAKRARVDVSLESAANALDEMKRFIGAVRADPGTAAERSRRANLVHATDHLERLVETLRDAAPARVAQRDPDTAAARTDALALLGVALDWLRGARPVAPVDDIADRCARLAQMRRDQRPMLIERTSTGEIDPAHALETLDATRWIDRIGYHVWRFAHHAQESPPDADRSRDGGAGTDASGGGAVVEP